MHSILRVLPVYLKHGCCESVSTPVKSDEEDDTMEKVAISLISKVERIQSVPSHQEFRQGQCRSGACEWNDIRDCKRTRRKKGRNRCETLSIKQLPLSSTSYDRQGHIGRKVKQ